MLDPNKAPRCSFNVLDIELDDRPNILSIEDGHNELILPVKGRVFEFECVDEDEARRWHAAIVSHFDGDHRKRLRDAGINTYKLNF